MTIPFCSTEFDRRRLLTRERERSRPEGKQRKKMLIHGGRFAVGAQSTMRGSVQITGDRVTRILENRRQCRFQRQTAQKLILADS